MICNMYVRIVAFVVWFSKSHFLKKKNQHNSFVDVTNSSVYIEF